MKVVVFLQNAWSPLYAGTTWPRESWLRALKKSRSGLKLNAMAEAAGGKFSWWYDNTTPQVSETAGGRLPPDLKHMGKVLETIKPRYVVGTGEQAAEALEQFNCKPCLLLPHPAHRVVTNFLYREAGRRLKAGFEDVLVILQCRGGILLSQATKESEYLEAGNESKHSA